MNMNRMGSWVVGALGVIALLVAPVWLTNSPYLMHLAITSFFYAILASSWSLLAGYAGQFSFGHMAFMAIGAYSAALMGYYVRFTTAATNLCRELSLGGIWIVLLNPQGVTQTNTPNCLEMAKTTMPVGTIIMQPPVWAGLL
ncbi:MAG: hypothetical protein KDE50_22915, partial [Caldilineaceae bacterium]|nr:hypothetical protein [Caldilineaceae bacterium]